MRVGGEGPGAGGEGPRTAGDPSVADRSRPPCGPPTVVKVGGSLARGRELRTCLRPIRRLREGGPVALVPGGGPFADTVRRVARRHGLDDSSAHWMAILAMDQYAYLLAAVVEDALIVRDAEQALAALSEETRMAREAEEAPAARNPEEALGSAARIPVIAPHDWLRREDPLPHAWEVTGDSIAAWIAGRLGAARLVLVKSDPARAGVDAYFATALPRGLAWEVVVPGSAGWDRIR